LPFSYFCPFLPIFISFFFPPFFPSFLHCLPLPRLFMLTLTAT
jgi:hypothetical protein